MREALVQASYLLASVLFILSLKSLSRADTAARGVDLAVAGMAIAIVGTLMQQTIIDYRWIALGLGVGTVVGIPLGTRVPMTAMPQRIAIALTFGASAATLVVPPLFSSARPRRPSGCSRASNSVAPTQSAARRSASRRVNAIEGGAAMRTRGGAGGALGFSRVGMRRTPGPRA